MLFQSEEESIEIIEDVSKSSPEPEIINSDDGKEPANDESSAVDTGSAEISRPNRSANNQENAEGNSADVTPAENAAQATNNDNDSDELEIPDGPETQVQSGVVDSGMESTIYNVIIT